MPNFKGSSAISVKLELKKMTVQPPSHSIHSTKITLTKLAYFSYNLLAVRRCSSLQYHYIHTKFHENQSNCSKVERGQTETKARTALWSHMPVLFWGRRWGWKWQVSPEWYQSTKLQGINHITDNCCLNTVHYENVKSHLLKISYHGFDEFSNMEFIEALWWKVPQHIVPDNGSHRAIAIAHKAGDTGNMWQE